MVKFRGIEISIISQFDIRKLPEFRFRQQSPPPADSSCPKTDPPSPSKAVASCYVPIYPGSQIWFEYCIDGPHPPTAAYLFKFLMNGKVVTSWDCTEQHDYHGKMMYNLTYQGEDFNNGAGNIVRQALKFASEIVDDGQITERKDVMEIRVHRIEHRKRIRDLNKEIDQIRVRSDPDDSLQLSNGGLLEQELPCRRYRYQLLDPVDEPYATFRFHYRTYDFLETHGIIAPAHPFSSSPPPQAQHDGTSSIPESMSDEEEDGHPRNQSTPRSSPITYSIKMVSSASDLADSTRSEEQAGQLDRRDGSMEIYIPPSDSDESLSIVTKDSIEDLPSTVRRSPRSSKFPANVHRQDNKGGRGGSPEASPPLSPRRRLKKKLTVNIDGAEFDLGHKKRPLSPFTSSGMLRKLTGGVPPSAPAAVTEFGPTLEDEVQEKMKLEEQKSETLRRTTRAERGGKSLMSFLGRRLGGV